MEIAKFKMIIIQSLFLYFDFYYFILNLFYKLQPKDHH